MNKLLKKGTLIKNLQRHAHIFYSWRTKKAIRERNLDFWVNQAIGEMGIKKKVWDLTYKEKQKIRTDHIRWLKKKPEKKIITNPKKPKMGLERYKIEESVMKEFEASKREMKVKIDENEKNGIFGEINTKNGVFGDFGKNDISEEKKIKLLKKKLFSSQKEINFQDVELLQNNNIINILNETEKLNLITNRFFQNNLNILNELVLRMKLEDKKSLEIFFNKISQKNNDFVYLLKFLNIFEIRNLDIKNFSEIIKKLFLDKKIKNCDKFSLLKFILKSNKDLVNSFLPLLSNILENFKIEKNFEILDFNILNFPFLEFLKKDKIFCYFLIDSILFFKNLEKSKKNFFFSFLILNKIENNENCEELFFLYSKNFGEENLEKNIFLSLKKIYKFYNLETNLLNLENSYKNFQNLEIEKIYNNLENMNLYYNNEKIIIFEKKKILEENKKNKNFEKMENLLDFINEKEKYVKLNNFDIYKNNLTKINDISLQNFNIDFLSRKNIIDYSNRVTKIEKRYTFENMRINQNLKNQEKMIKIIKNNFSEKITKKKNFLKILKNNFSKNDENENSDDILKSFDKIILDVAINDNKKTKEKNVLELQNMINSKKDINSIKLFLEDLNKEKNEIFLKTFVINFFKMKIKSDNDTNLIIKKILFDNKISDSEKLFIKYDTNFGKVDQNYNKYNLNKNFPQNFKNENFFSILEYLENNFNRLYFKISFSNFLRNQEKKINLQNIKIILNFMIKKKMSMTILDFYYFLLQNDEIDETKLILFMKALENFKFFYDENINLYKSYFKKIKKLPLIDLIKKTMINLVILEKEKNFEKRAEDLRLFFESFQHSNNPKLSPKENSDALKKSLEEIKNIKNIYLLFLFELTVKYKKKNFSKIIYTELLENKIFNVTHLLYIFKFLNQNFNELPIFLQYYTEVILPQEENKEAFRGYKDEIKLELLDIIEKNLSEVKSYIQTLFYEFLINQAYVNNEMISKKLFSIIYKIQYQKLKEYLLIQIFKANKKKFQLEEICKTITLDIIKETRDEEIKNEILEKMQAYFGEYNLQAGERDITYNLNNTNPFGDFKKYIGNLNLIIFHSRFETRENRMVLSKDKKIHPTKRPVKEKRGLIEQLLVEGKEIPHVLEDLQEAKQDLEQRDVDFLSFMKKKAGKVVSMNDYLERNEEDFKDLNEFRLSLKDLDDLKFCFEAGSKDEFDQGNFGYGYTKEDEYSDDDNDGDL